MRKNDIKKEVKLESEVEKDKSIVVVRGVTDQTESREE